MCGGRGKPKLEVVVVAGERQMTVDIPLLGSSRPAAAPRGAQCSFSDFLVNGSKRHALECHLSGIFREDLHGQEITIRRIGALSMIATWLMGDRVILRSLS